MTTTIIIEAASHKVKIKTVRPSDGDVQEIIVEPFGTHIVHIHSDLRISSIEEVGEDG
jgi:hypothetical protein